MRTFGIGQTIAHVFCNFSLYKNKKDLTFLRAYNNLKVIKINRFCIPLFDITY